MIAHNIATVISIMKAILLKPMKQQSKVIARVASSACTLCTGVDLSNVSTIHPLDLYYEVTCPDLATVS
jgi:hypothetical protein